MWNFSDTHVLSNWLRTIFHHRFIILHQFQSFSDNITLFKVCISPFVHYFGTPFIKRIPIRYMNYIISGFRILKFFMLSYGIEISQGVYVIDQESRKTDEHWYVSDVIQLNDAPVLEYHSGRTRTKLRGKCFLQAPKTSKMLRQIFQYERQHVYRHKFEVIVLSDILLR